VPCLLGRCPRYGRGREAARKAHPGIIIENLPELAAALESADVEVAWDGEFPGHDRFYAPDPFGDRLEFLEPQQQT
jgi:hypothetical protein